MISNPAEKIKCAACETPKPGAKQPESSNGFKSSFGDAGGFKFGSSDSGSSSAVFGSTLGANGGTGFGAAFSSNTSTVAATSGFNFGASEDKDSEKETIIKPAGGFSFGNSDKKNTELPVSGFVFGTPSVEKSSSSVFAFGSNSSPKTASASAFGTNEISAKSSSFSFGNIPSSEKVEKPTGFAFISESKDTPAETKSSAGEFSFGSEPSVSSVSNEQVVANGKSSNSGAGPTVFSAAKPFNSESSGNSGLKDGAESKEYNSDYLAHLKALNLQVTEWIKRHIEENPLVILSPVFQDYEKHLKEISEKYPSKTSVTQQYPGASSFQISPNAQSPVKPPELIKPFSFGASSVSNAEPAKFSFGSVSQKKPDSTPTGFSFGLSDKPTGERFSFGSGNSGAFSAPVPSQPASVGQEAEDEDSPPVVEVKQVPI